MATTTTTAPTPLNDVAVSIDAATRMKAFSEEVHSSFTLWQHHNARNPSLRLGQDKASAILYWLNHPQEQPRDAEQSRYKYQARHDYDLDIDDRGSGLYKIQRGNSGTQWLKCIGQIEVFGI